ncbi:MAG: YCF48-related protein, partial [Planctomycetota bacterium]
MRPRFALAFTSALLSGCTSTEGGFRLSWRPQHAHTSASLRGVSAVDAETCWASGTGGTFLRTTDGGRTWTSGSVPGAQELDFRDVHAFDANTALLLSAGSPGEVWRTTDGGQTWRRTHRDTSEGVFFDALGFGDSKRGMAFGDPVDGSFLLLRTTDAGTSWKRVDPMRLPAPIDGEAGFAASGTCLAALGKKRIWVGTGGSAARVLRTTDGGASWSVAATPLRQCEPSSGVFSVAFLDAQRGIVVGGDYSRPLEREGTAAFTTDGGATWRLARGQPGYRSCVALAPVARPRMAVAIGKEGSSLSLDAGETWEAVDLPGHYALSFAPRARRGTAVGWAV